MARAQWQVYGRLTALEVTLSPPDRSWSAEVGSSRTLSFSMIGYDTRMVEAAKVNAFRLRLKDTYSPIFERRRRLTQAPS
jgi:hypothetical protein